MRGWRGALPFAAALLLVMSFALRSNSADLHKRGARVLHGARARRARQRRRPLCKAPLTLAGVPITGPEETRHFKLIGTTGTGKSTAIRGFWPAPSRAETVQSSPTRKAVISSAFMTAGAGTAC